MLAKNINNVTIVVFFYFSKAFSSVYHNPLIHKLNTFKLATSFCGWFRSYFGGKWQRIIDANGNHSEWDRLMCCTLQGSSLSSLLFKLFILDFGKCKYHKYADDFKSYLSGPLFTLPKFLKMIENYINNVTNWKKDNQLLLNLLLNFKNTSASNM